ncbi:MAG: hypothetical protein AAF985_17885 [Bacteroidota bacterium]
MKYLFYCFCLLFLFGCDNGLETVEEKAEDGSVTRYVRKKENFAKHGLLVRIDANGLKLEESNYEEDVLHGERRLYYESGELQIVEHHTQGQFEGSYQIFHKNGQVKFEAAYQNGSLEGKGKSYYEDGQVKEIVTFANNEENGPFEEFHPNGKVKARGEYLDGDNEHGLLELFDEDGVLVKKMNCTRGICRTSWKKDKGEAES